MNKLVRYFPKSDLRSSYVGLSAIAKKEGINLNELSNGNFVCFVNTKQNKLKMCTRNNVVAYLSLDKGKIDPRTIMSLPEYFNGAHIDYDKALRAVVKTHFPKWFSDNK